MTGSQKAVLEAVIAEKKQQKESLKSMNGSLRHQLQEQEDMVIRLSDHIYLLEMLVEGG